MLLDIILALYICFGLVMGFRRGIRSEIIKLCGALFGIIIVYFTSGIISNYFLESQGVTYLESRIFGFLTGLGIIFFFMIIPSLIYSLFRSETPGLPARLVGSGFGGIKNLLIALVIAGLIQYAPGISDSLQNGALSKTYDKTLSEPVEDSLGQNHIVFSGKQIVEDPKKMEQLKQTKEIQSLANDPRIQELANDPEIVKAAKNRNFTAIAEHPKVNDLLRDEEFRRKARKKLRKAMSKIKSDPPN